MSPAILAEMFTHQESSLPKICQECLDPLPYPEKSPMIAASPTKSPGSCSVSTPKTPRTPSLLASALSARRQMEQREFLVQLEARGWDPKSSMHLFMVTGHVWRVFRTWAFVCYFHHHIKWVCFRNVQGHQWIPMVVVTEGQEMTDVLWFVSCMSLYFPYIYIYCNIYIIKLQYVISYYSPRVG